LVGRQSKDTEGKIKKERKGQKNEKGQINNNNQKYLSDDKTEVGMSNTGVRREGKKN